MTFSQRKFMFTFFQMKKKILLRENVDTIIKTINKTLKALVKT